MLEISYSWFLDYRHFIAVHTTEHMVFLGFLHNKFLKYIIKLMQLKSCIYFHLYSLTGKFLYPSRSSKTTYHRQKAQDIQK